jgi:glutamate-1-semialdehyde 2,1-aminomutase
VTTVGPRPTPNLAGSNELRDRFHARIPGGAHTYAKGDDQWPEGLAPILVSGLGSHVTDVDGNTFLEFGSGLRAVTLGHARADVIDHIARRMRAGQNFTRPSILELEVADRLAELVGADMVKFAKNSSDATSAAIRLARAATGRDLVAVCGTQPFFSVDDWFMGTTPVAAGIPEAVRALTRRFPYNDLAAARALLESEPGGFAALILEPATYIEPEPGYLEGLRALAHEHGTLLVFDETITGFRWHIRGSQGVYGVEPDLAIFGKGMGNGFAIAALVGRRDLMAQGGLDHDGQRVFLLSYTHGAETVGLAAAEAVMDIYEREDIVGRLYDRGDRLRRGIDEVTRSAGTQDHVRAIGRSCNLVYQTLDEAGHPSQPFRTLFLQELVTRGILAPSLIVGAAHEDADIDFAIEQFGEACVVYRRALDEGVDRYLRGRPVQPVMRALNWPSAGD